MRLRALFLMIIVSSLLLSFVGSDLVQSYGRPGEIYWDRGDFIISHMSDYEDVAPCTFEPAIKLRRKSPDTPTNYTILDDDHHIIIKELVKCLKGRGESTGEELLAYTEKLKEDDFSKNTRDALVTGAFTEFEFQADGMRGKCFGPGAHLESLESGDIAYGTTPEDHGVELSNDKTTMTSKTAQCNFSYQRVVTSHLTFAGKERSSDEQYFVNQDPISYYGNDNDCKTFWIRLRYNGTVSETSATCERIGPDDSTSGRVQSAKDLFNGKVAKGRASRSYLENSYVEAMNEQYNTLKEEYEDNCRKPNSENIPQDCNGAIYGPPGGFTQIWRTCVVATGNRQADIDNAANCLLTYANVKINTEAVREAMPRDPNEFKDVDSCGVRPAGFIVCPVVRSMASMADSMFSALQSLLHISPLDRSNLSGQTAHKTWSVFANIANIIFAIMFLAIVISQVTGLGIDNYGIKKMLPRLIIAAILVNASFYICVAAIDLSNILGDSLRKVMMLINDSLPSGMTKVSSDISNINSAQSNTSWKFVSNSILASSVLVGGAAAVAALIYMFVPIITTVILAGVTVLLVLLARYALIILLLIVAPVAFASFLLPNTAKWFNRWRNMFISLLALYPVLSIVFGLSTLAANIILNVASARDSQLLTILALAIQAIPLAISPLIVRLGGQTLGNISGSIQSSGLFKRAREGAKDRQKDINTGLKLRAIQGKWTPGGSLIRRKAKTDLIRQSRGGELSRLEADYVSDYISGKSKDGAKVGTFEKLKGKMNDDYVPKTKGEKMLGEMAKGGSSDAKERAAAAAYSVQSKLLDDEVKANKIVMEKMNSDDIVHGLGDVLNSQSVEDTTYSQKVPDPTVSASDIGDEANMWAIANTKNNAKVLAGINTVGSRKNNAAMKKVIMMSGSMNGIQRAGAVSQMASSDMAFLQHPAAQQAVNAGLVTDEESFHKEVVAPYFSEGFASGSDFAKTDVDALQILKRAQESGHLDHDTSLKIAQAARDAASNEKVMAHLDSSEAAIVGSIASWSPS